jgi:hypothetical protein
LNGNHIAKIDEENFPFDLDGNAGRRPLAQRLQPGKSFHQSGRLFLCDSREVTVCDEIHGKLENSLSIVALQMVGGNTHLTGFGHSHYDPATGLV